jgi:hypothetical protein
VRVESVAESIPTGELRQRRAAVTLWRRPLLLAFVLGCGVSLLASGRFTLRLVVDGTISFAFVPLCELVAFADRLPSATAARGTFRVRLKPDTTLGAIAISRETPRGCGGWWRLMAVIALLPARRLGSILAPLLFTSPLPIALSVRFDWRLFRG